MNSNKNNSNNFLLGVSSNKNNSLEKVNNKNMLNTYSPVETKKIVFGIIDKLESDIVELNNKIFSLNKEKSNLKNISNKEIEELKQVIKKLYMVLSSLYKSSNLETINHLIWVSIKKIIILI
jgi:molecular chaperone GrpE (heat shock protein)